MNVVLLAALVSSSIMQSDTLEKSDRTTEMAAMCFKTGEQVSGMNKICFYDCLGSAKAITIGSVELCPLSIND